MLSNQDIWQKMLSGEPYDAAHPHLIERLQATRRLLWEFNSLNPADEATHDRLIRRIIGRHGERIHVNAPFRCDYGENICVGENFFANFNLTILDEAPVTIGANAFIGPNVSMYTACHPLDPQQRNALVEWAEPITIGDNVWIGGSATILPGVTIGDNVVIGAGAVVTHSFPSNCVIAGNPARKIKDLTPGG